MNFSRMFTFTRATLIRMRTNSSVSTPKLPQGFFTPAEIAEYLGFSTYTVQDLCRRGSLRHVKSGRSIRIRKQWADDYMASLEREPLQLQ
jgi:excisionase family DNA binding protein